MQVQKNFRQSKLKTFCAVIALSLSALCAIESSPVFANMIGPPPLSSLMSDCTYAVVVEVSKVETKHDKRVAECQAKGLLTPKYFDPVGEVTKMGPGRIPLVTYKNSKVIAKASPNTAIPNEFKREFVAFSWDCAGPPLYFALPAPKVGSKMIIVGLSQGYMYVDYNLEVDKKLGDYFKLTDTKARTKYSETNLKSIFAFSGSV